MLIHAAAVLTSFVSQTHQFPWNVLTALSSIKLSRLAISQLMWTAQIESALNLLLSFVYICINESIKMKSETLLVTIFCFKNRDYAYFFKLWVIHIICVYDIHLQTNKNFSVTLYYIICENTFLQHCNIYVLFIFPSIFLHFSSIWMKFLMLDERRTLLHKSVWIIFEFNLTMFVVI